MIFVFSFSLVLELYDEFLEWPRVLFCLFWEADVFSSFAWES